jgi:hypothetical protein
MLSYIRSAPVAGHASSSVVCKIFTLTARLIASLASL